MGMWGWRKYVPVAKQREQAKRKIDQLKKKGIVIQPIEIQGRTIAKKFWGKRWCEHLETFADFENRLPRGRTYARNGSICHLKIEDTLVEAFVSGSKLYTVKIKIKPLKKQQWKQIKKKCTGEIGSLLELLKGEFSDQLMEVVTNPKEGLFPTEEEIDFSCNCPDWADMCKHVAAALYGVAARLDEHPEYLFLLRAVNAQELVSTTFKTESIKTENLLEQTALGEVFDIDIDETNSQILNREKKRDLIIDLSHITAKDLQKMRLKMNLSPQEFAIAIGCTTQSVYRWEKAKGALRLNKRFVKSITTIAQKHEFKCQRDLN